jgi:adenylate cyclase
MKYLVHPAVRLSLLLLLLTAMAASFGKATDIKHRISNLVFEAYMEMKPRTGGDQIAFVDIDDQSVTRVGQWPWPRSVIAEMITKIKEAGAAVIVFDGVLAEPDRTSPDYIAGLLGADHPARPALMEMDNNDTVLAQAIDDAGNFVAGFSYGSNAAAPLLKGRILAKRDVRDFFLAQKQTGGMYFRNTAQFLPDLQAAAAGNGSFMASLDDDAVIRQTNLVFHNGTDLYPSLILEALRLYDQETKGYVKLNWNEDFKRHPFQQPFYAELGKYRIPVSAEGQMWIYFRHFEADAQIPAYVFLDAHTDTQALPDLSGKIVFIASEAEGLKDLRATPIGNMAGVKVHMNAMEQILQGQYLIRPTKGIDYEFFAGASVSLFIILMSFFAGPLWLLSAAIVFCAGSVGASWMLFDRMGVLLDPVTPMVMVIATFIAASVLSFLKTEIEKRYVRDAFGLYISPAFMKELTANPDKLKLGGEIRELTIMFTDIRKFTTICEGLGPEEIIQLMNDFLTPMSDMVMHNRGTIDKYMGDAMMAFWNAPLDDADHARNACRAAIGMQKALGPVNDKVRKQAEEKGKEPVLLRAGIGINTGESAVGNMGSKQRFAYSTLGDAVNLASRLEGQTKTYGVGVLIGEKTYLQASDFAALEMDLVQVVGKSEAVHIYALLGDEALATDKDYVAQKAAHEAMIALYRAGDFKGALKACKALSKSDQFDLGTAYALYQTRCEAFIKKPPENWTGVTIAQSK